MFAAGSHSAQKAYLGHPLIIRGEPGTEITGDVYVTGQNVVLQSLNWPGTVVVSSGASVSGSDCPLTAENLALAPTVSAGVTARLTQTKLVNGPGGGGGIRVLDSLLSVVECHMQEQSGSLVQVMGSGRAELQYCELEGAMNHRAVLWALRDGSVSLALGTTKTLKLPWVSPTRPRR